MLKDLHIDKFSNLGRSQINYNPNDRKERGEKTIIGKPIQLFKEDEKQIHKKNVQANGYRVNNIAKLNEDRVFFKAKQENMTLDKNYLQFMDNLKISFQREMIKINQNMHSSRAIITKKILAWKIDFKNQF